MVVEAVGRGVVAEAPGVGALAEVGLVVGGAACKAMAFCGCPGQAGLRSKGKECTMALSSRTWAAIARHSHDWKLGEGGEGGLGGGGGGEGGGLHVKRDEENSQMPGML